MAIPEKEDESGTHYDKLEIYYPWFELWSSSHKLDTEVIYMGALDYYSVSDCGEEVVFVLNTGKQLHLTLQEKSIADLLKTLDAAIKMYIHDTDNEESVEKIISTVRVAPATLQ